MKTEDLDRTVGVRAISWAFYLGILLFAVAALLGGSLGPTVAAPFARDSPRFLFPFVRQHYAFMVERNGEAGYVFVLAVAFQLVLLISFCAFLVRMTVLFTIWARTGRCEHRFFDVLQHRGGGVALAIVGFYLAFNALAASSVFLRPELFTRYIHTGSSSDVHIPIVYFGMKALIATIALIFLPNLLFSLLHATLRLLGFGGSVEGSKE